MINERTSHTRTLTARVGRDPRFDNSIHDDRSAETYGFRSALVPGPILTSYMTHLYVQAWGEAWLRRGRMTQRSRRPVYEGQTLTATAEPVTNDAGGQNVSVLLRNAEGEEVASSTGELPQLATPAPDLAGFPHRPHADVTPHVVAGGHRPGDVYGSTPFAYTREMHDDYLDKASETLPIYRDRLIVHPGFLLSLTMREAIASYVKPSPGVHVSVIGQNFGLAFVGDTLSTSGQVVNTFEKKGNHYTESDQLIIANGRLAVALFRRTSIYALKTVSA